MPNILIVDDDVTIRGMFARAMKTLGDVEELLSGGSIYWVIKGEVAAREKLIAIEPFRDKDGIGRCRLVMQPKVIAVSPRPMRAFQGWRYLTEDGAPADLGKAAAASVASMPEPMRRELRDLGLL